jgi:ankyrin repeat protein
LAAGTDVDARDILGSTALRYGIYSGHKEIAELLIAKGADVRAEPGGVSTPLHWASSGDHKEIVELLIANGADVNARANNGKTPLDDAEGKTADLLRKHGGKTAKELKAE